MQPVTTTFRSTPAASVAARPVRAVPSTDRRGASILTAIALVVAFVVALVALVALVVVMPDAAGA